jgi:Protein of unknown function (DUF3365)
MIHHGVGRSRCALVWRRATLVLTASAVFSAAHELRAAPATDERVNRATRAVNELKLSLRNELEQAMAAGGPDNAIGICRERTPALARDIGQKHGVLVGRSSHKLRNSNNAPRPWVKAVLDEWLKVSATERKPRVVPVSNDVVGYVEPIGTQGLCLTCHGEQVAESIRVKLRASYPGDLAIGFKEGELRGALWAEARTKESK